MRQVTVLMAVHNGERFLRDAVDSILRQTFNDFEFIIIDDGSTDSTQDILADYTDQRIKILVNSKNIGLTKSLNKGLQIAQGEYIARQDADDLSLPQRLEKEARFLDSHPQIGLVGCHSQVIDEKSRALYKISPPSHDKAIKQRLLKGNSFVHGSVMMRKSCVNLIGGYNDDFPLVQDYDLWLRIAEISHTANISEVLYYWRFRLKSISSQNKALQDMYVCLAKQLAQERQQLGREKTQVTPNTLKRLGDKEKRLGPRQSGQRARISQNYNFWAKKLLKENCHKVMLQVLIKSIFHAPFNYETWMLIFSLILKKLGHRVNFEK